MSGSSSNLLSLGTLVNLADSKTAERAASFGAMPADLQASMQEAMAKRVKDANDAAANVLVDLFERKDAFLVRCAQNISNLEKQIEDQKALAAKVQRANDYGMETRNFLPLSKSIGDSIPSSINAELLKIPAAWAPAEAASDLQTAVDAGRAEGNGTVSA